MNRYFSRVLALVSVLCCGLAHGQLAVSLRLNKAEFLSGEQVVAVVSITNHSGRDIEFQGYLDRPWLDFSITKRNGEPVVPTGRGIFGKLKLPTGQTLTRQVSLSAMFQLYDQGNYSVAATVRMPGMESETTVSSRHLFSVSPGRPYWTQKVGVSRFGKVREYRVLNFSAEGKTQLYVQIADGQTGLPLRTFSIGEALLVRQPSITVDGAQRMHILYLATPNSWVHAQVDSDGRVTGRDFHLRGPQGDPFLVTSGKGAVAVANSLPYDPKAVAAERAKRRKISDRPPGTY